MMSKRLRWVVLLVSHLAAVAAGLGAVSAFVGREAAGRSLGTPRKMVGGALMALGDNPRPEDASRGLSVLASAKSHLGEPVAPVLQLRMLTAAARASRDERDIARAVQACLARRWPKCDSAAVVDMGAGR